MEYLIFVLGMLLLGASVGLVSAALGIGGGILMVPALREFVSGMDPHTAKGTSLFIIIFVAALNSWRLNRGRPDKLWRLAIVIACGSIVGGYFGGWVTGFMSPDAVTWVFVGGLGLLGLRLLFVDPRTVKNEDVRRRDVPGFFIGLAAGIASGMTGTGGGAVLVPLALLAGIVSNARVVGLSNTVMVATAFAGTIAHLRAVQTCGVPGTFGQVSVLLAPIIFLGAQLGSPVGTRLNAKLTFRRRKVVMGVLTLVIAARLVYRLMR